MFDVPLYSLGLQAKAESTIRMLQKEGTATANMEEVRQLLKDIKHSPLPPALIHNFQERLHALIDENRNVDES